MKELIERLGIVKPDSWNGKLFFPVIHLPDYNQAIEAVLREATIAREAEADGIILISHGEMSTQELSEVWEFANQEVGTDEFLVGINWLSLTSTPGTATKLAGELGVPLLWSDAWFGAPEIQEARKATNWRGAFCGAFSFKVGPTVPLDQIPGELDKAYGFMDVPITSGDGTGIPIEPEKATAIRRAAGSRPLGIASGVSLKNLSWQGPLFDWFFVSSSLSLNGDWYRHDAKKTKETSRAIASL